MEILEKSERQSILDSLSISGQKPLGYLPLATIEKVLAMDVAELTNSLQGRGAKVAIFSKDDCCIKSGALYAYDPTALQKVLNAAAEPLSQGGWPSSADAFVKKVAKVWIDETDPIYEVILRAFGELR